MQKLFSFIRGNILFLISLFLLAFIPLYPKLPLLDIKNTWVYIRVEDFLVLFVLCVFAFLLVKRKITLKTPLTIPIMAFWLIGALATIHGVILIFPLLPNVFPNVALLSYFRHIEYMSLFFVAYAGLKDKKLLPYVVGVLALTLFGIIMYGFGQKYAGFPAFLTMNEEFAKGVPIQLSQLSRVPSTFAGHYDLAAYLVLIIPIFASLIFGVRSKIIKLCFMGLVGMGVILLFMTVSRVSFFVLIISLFLVLFFQKKRFVLFSIPVVIAFAFLFLTFQSTLFERFGNTVKEVDVLVDAKTGQAVGHVEYVSKDYFDDKTIRLKRIIDKEQLDTATTSRIEDIEDISIASPSAILPSGFIPDPAPLVIATNISTGEHLTQGTGYINLSLSPVIKRLGSFFYEMAPNLQSTTSAEVINFHGDFIVKRASAYDLSFTTRLQGEWPHALEAFWRNVLFGSGYGSVSLAVDNNFLRTLGEIGLLGLTSFFVIFLALGIYIRKILPDVDSRLARSFILGFTAGLVGLFLNATLIDVFEASKVAFVLWLLIGIVVGLLHAYNGRAIDMYKQLKNAALSTYAIVIYLALVSIVTLSPTVSNFFVGDDFVWFRYASDCRNFFAQQCSPLNAFVGYFLDFQNYAPLTKFYFYIMYSTFWLNQNAYHVVSLSLHFVVAVLLLLLSQKVLKSKLLATLSAFLFLFLSGYSQVVFWISSTGLLFAVIFVLLSILSYIKYLEKKSLVYYVFSIVSIIVGLLFSPIAIVAPIFAASYKLFYSSTSVKNMHRNMSLLILFIPSVVYLAFLMMLSGISFEGVLHAIQYLPGNVIGYIFLILTGPLSLPVGSVFVELSKNIFVSITIWAIAAVVIGLFLRIIFRKILKDDGKVFYFCITFFVVSLLPFAFLQGPVSSGGYLSSLGLMMLLSYSIYKAYGYLLVNGKDIALSTVCVGCFAFILLHVIQVQQINKDWHTAGEASKNFFVSIDGLYSNYWSDEEVSFYFVNVPVQSGEAPIFPGGLTDALWLSFNNEKLTARVFSTTEEALNNVKNARLQRVFEFRDDGRVDQVFRKQ